MRKNAKPLYLFAREVAVYNDLKKNGPSHLEDACQRLNGLGQTDVVQILRDLTSRSLVTKVGTGTRKIYRVSLLPGTPKILTRPSQD